MTDLKFSKRIETIAKYINNKSTVADIGTDHGYLPLYLLLNNYDVDIIAADIREDPLKKARRNAKQAGVEDRIRFCLSDGLEGLVKRADTYVICGMGGYVIMHILEKAIAGDTDIKDAEFVISPHSDERVLREFLCKNGFRTEDEEMIRDKEFFYPIIHCVYDGEKREESEVIYSYGSQPLKEKQPALKNYLLREKRILSDVLEKLGESGSGNATDRAKEIKQKLLLNEEAQKFFI